MNHTITHALNEITGTHLFLDAMVLVYAEIMPWFAGFFFCVLIIFSYTRTIRPFVFSALVLSILAVLNAALKMIFNLQRPFEMYQTIEPVFITYGFGSFPSSHALFFAGITTLSFFFLSKRFAYFFLIITIVIGFARVISGVHFFFDIVVGWILGFLLTYGALYAYKNSIGRED
jgi:undecaprenyl-diphosphatase